MLTLCYAPGSLKAFINGQLVGADDKTIYSIPLNNGAINWHIWWNGTASRGHSIYDDIGIWNRGSRCLCRRRLNGLVRQFHSTKYANLLLHYSKG